jgi:hypothetical protein
MKLYNCDKTIANIEQAVRQFQLDMATVKGQIFAELAEDPLLREQRYQQLYKQRLTDFNLKCQDLLNELSKYVSK